MYKDDAIGSYFKAGLKLNIWLACIEFDYAIQYEEHGSWDVGIIVKVWFGCSSVLIISILSKSKAFYIAGLVPLFPTFALIAHVIVSQQQGAQALRTTALFGLWAIVPYAIYLLMVYALAPKMSMWSCLSLATLCWVVAAAGLIYGWQMFQH